VIEGPSLRVPPLGPTDRLVSLARFHLKNSADGSPPRLGTTVRVGTRGGALLVRFDGRDRGVVATLTERDGPLWKEDVFEVFLSSTTSSRSTLSARSSTPASSRRTVAARR
jgi:hypothetical protein